MSSEACITSAIIEDKCNIYNRENIYDLIWILKDNFFDFLDIIPSIKYQCVDKVFRVKVVRDFHVRVSPGTREPDPREKILQNRTRNRQKI